MVDTVDIIDTVVIVGNVEILDNVSKVDVIDIVGGVVSAHEPMKPESTKVTLTIVSPVVLSMALPALSSKHVTLISYVKLKLVSLSDVRTVLPK